MADGRRGQSLRPHGRVVRISLPDYSGYLGRYPNYSPCHQILPGIVMISPNLPGTSSREWLHEPVDENCRAVANNKGCPSDPTRIVDLEQFFGSKTPYDSARRMLEVRQPTSHHRPCERSEVVMVWAVVRHGSRCPTPHRFRDTGREWYLRRGKNSTLRRERTDWCPRERPYRIGSCVLEDAGMLTEKGQVEMYELGQRMRARFPSLFKSRYSPIRYDIQSSHPFRALQSAYSFAEGVFGGTGNLGPANSQ
eukprot:504694-Amorphochlora_amoeboformis.AAC.1